MVSDTNSEATRAIAKVNENGRKSSPTRPPTSAIGRNTATVVIVAEVMAPEDVNAMLYGIGFPTTTFTNTELCSLLQVDAIIWGNIDIREPVSEAAAMALSNNSWFIPITNLVEINLKLYDNQTDTQLWSVYCRRSGQLGSLKRKMQMDVCRRATRNIPYNIKKKKYKKAYLILQNGTQN